MGILNFLTKTIHCPATYWWQWKSLAGRKVLFNLAFRVLPHSKISKISLNYPL